MKPTTTTPTFLPEKMRKPLAGLAVFGIGCFAVALALDPGSAFSGYLLASFYILTLALGSVAFLAMMSVGSSGWHASVKRVPEALGATLPFAAILILGLLIGLDDIYPWANAAHGGHDAHAAGGHAGAAKAFYLQPGFFALRMVGVLAIWIAFGWALRKNSLAQDKDGDVSRTKRNVALSACFLLTFGVTFTVASADWLMSRDPHWVSTIFALYNMAGMVTGATAAILVGVIVLRRSGHLDITSAHLHDLGKFLFAFSTVWAYLWLSQYLLIWYANLPEEVEYYIQRTQGLPGVLFYVNIVVNWAIPFLVLLPAKTKRSEQSLFLISLLILAGRWLDLHLLVLPPSPAGAHLVALEILGFAGLAAAFALVADRALRAAPLMPKGDPYLVEALSLGREH